MPAPIGKLASELTEKRLRAYEAEHATRRKVISLALVTGVAVVIAIFVALATRPAPPPPVETAAPAADEEPTINAHGNIPKELGEAAGFGTADEPDQNTFAINRITVDPPCTPEGTKPADEHTVLLELTVTTGADEERAAQLGRILTPGFFSVIDADGAEHDAWPGECTDPARTLPDTFTADERYTGTVELRVPAASGALVLAGHMENANGWEWSF